MPHKARVQDVAARKLAHATRRIRENQERIIAYTVTLHRAAVALRDWQRKAAYYTGRAALTDAQVEAERVARLARPPRNRKRAISVREDI